MSKSALKYLVRSGVTPKHCLVRQNTFATNRTQQRKRIPTAETVEQRVRDKKKST